jgi:hypothetical protein
VKIADSYQVRAEVDQRQRPTAIQVELQTCWFNCMLVILTREGFFRTHLPG